ncbi:MAG: ABC transporter substrate-binding protein [candidate division WOR-3 bacterium]
MKKITTIVLLILIIFSCKKKYSKTEITFWHAMGGPLGKTLETMVRQFERENPDIKIVLVGMGDYGALAQKLMGAIAVNSPPTIAQVYETWTTQFLQQNQLFPLDSFIYSPDGLTPDEIRDIYPVFIENNQWGGKFISFPFNKSVPVYFYNKKLFDSLGINAFPTTWDEFRAVLKKLTIDNNNDNKPEIWGTGGGVNVWQFGCMLYQQSVRFLDEEHRKAKFNSEAGIKIIKYMLDIIYKDSTFNFLTGYEPQNDFLAGKLGLIWGTIVSWAFMRDKMTFPVGIAPIPTWNGKPAVLVYGTNIAMFRNSTDKQKAAAWRFIKWFTRPKQQAFWAKNTFYVPICRSALNEPEYAQLLHEVDGLKEAIAQLEYAYFEPRGEEWFSGRRYLGEALEEALRLKNSPQEALDNAAQKIEKEWRMR